MTKRTALVVCPGRGTYNREELGYLDRHHRAHAELFGHFDEQRRALGQEPIAELDGADSFSAARFSRGDNASALIYACAFADFLAIDRDEFDLVAVTGNSMGWYIALACGGALTAEAGFRVVNTMGTLMQKSLIGGQVIYPFVDDDWVEIPGRRERLMELIASTDGLYLSIDLGGMVVFGGHPDALAAAQRALPPVGRFPMKLPNHAAFHTPLQATVAGQGQDNLPLELFRQPNMPLIDGRGHTWLPEAVDLPALWHYTFQTQITEPYNFTAAVRHGLREFAPDVLIVLGPGRTLGGAIAQVLIADEWRGLRSKQDFVDQQAAAPFLLAMGIDAQRARVVRSN